MEEELKSTITQLIVELESGIEFTKGQAPIIVEQILRYDMISSLLLMIFGIMLLLFASYSIYKFSNDIGDGVFVVAIAWFAGLGLSLGNITTIIKIYIAPNLYILDYLRDMV